MSISQEVKAKNNEAYVNMGARNEEIYTPIIQRLIDPKAKKTATYFCSTDFRSYTSNIELKSRTCKSTSYENTMFGANKLNYAWKGIRDFNKKVFFIFAFTDGLFKWELNQENYDLAGGDTAIYVGGTDERGWNDYKDHFHIPIEQLEKIDDTPCFVPDELLHKTEWKPKEKITGCLLKIKK